MCTIAGPDPATRQLVVPVLDAPAARVREPCRAAESVVVVRGRVGDAVDDARFERNAAEGVVVEACRTAAVRDQTQTADGVVALVIGIRLMGARAQAKQSPPGSVYFPPMVCLSTCLCSIFSRSRS